MSRGAFGILRVELRPPSRTGVGADWSESVRTAVHEVTISPEQWAKTFAPLPREREVPFAVEAQDRAARMANDRMHWSRQLGEYIAAEIIRTLQARDPQFGYSPEEWARIHKCDGNCER